MQQHSLKRLLQLCSLFSRLAAVGVRDHFVTGEGEIQCVYLLTVHCSTLCTKPESNDATVYKHVLV